MTQEARELVEAKEIASILSDRDDDDDAHAAATTITTLLDKLAAAERERDHFQAIAEDKLADTRLVSAGPKGGGFGFDFSGGPIPYIAEYLFQFIGARDEGGPSNYAEIEVQHREFGPMTLTIQRCSGKTPHQLKAEAEARADKLAAALEPFAAAADDIDDIVPDHAEMWENPASMNVSAGDFRAARSALAEKGVANG